MTNLENIDRSIFEALRLKSVNLGLFPDITEFNNKTDFENAKTSILNNTKILLEVFGVGNSESRDEKRASRITIDRINFVDGEIGSFGVTEFKKNSDNTYNKFKLPSKIYDLGYEVRLITNSIKAERIGLDLIITTLKNQNFLSMLNGSNHLLLLENYSNLSSNGLLEHYFRYTVKDVYLEENELILENIPQITEINPTITGIPSGEDSESESSGGSSPNIQKINFTINSF